MGKKSDSRPWWEKEYRELTRKERERIKNLRLFPSKRGRKREPEYDRLYIEIEMAKLSGAKSPQYRKRASRIVGSELSPKLDNPNQDTIQKFIRAYQRRKQPSR